MGNQSAGRMLLSTCERFELYLSNEGFDTEELIRELSRHVKITAQALHRHARLYGDDEVPKHLFRVAAGLESRIVGEAQILGQVREAFLLAESSGSLDAGLSALGRAAIRTGKRVRSETTLNARACSIATIAMDRLMKRGIGISGRRVLILGSGSLAEVVASEAAKRGPATIIIVGRTMDRCRALAHNHGGEAYLLGELPTQLARSDIVFACAAADRLLIESRMLANRDFGSHTIHLIDLAVPKIVDPQLAEMPGVHLMHLDELLQSAPAHVEGLAAAELIVRMELDKFIQWRRVRKVVGRIRALTETRRNNADASEMSSFELHQHIQRIKAEVAA